MKSESTPPDSAHEPSKRADYATGAAEPERAIRAESGRLLASARRLLGDPDEALEALQDGLLAAVKGLSNFDGRAQLSTWLHRIVINHALLRLRQRSRRPEVSIDELLPKFTQDGHHLAPPAHWVSDPSEGMQRSETRELLHGCVERLPETYRLPLILRDLEGLEFAAIGELLEISPNAAKIRAHRGRQSLKTLLDPHFQEGAP